LERIATKDNLSFIDAAKDNEIGGGVASSVLPAHHVSKVFDY